MGLDIRINTTKIGELYAAEPTKDYFHEHSLSRTFCNFMSRKDVCNGEPELDQIGRIVGLDIKPLYDMNKYIDDSDLKRHLIYLESEEDKLNFEISANNVRNKLTGNLEKTLNLINQLIANLSELDNLDALLTDNGNNTIFDSKYFFDFKIDKGDGYIGNNFGQDLRNFKRFLEFAKENGRTTVWFHYG
jgi:hypothetical protein